MNRKLSTKEITQLLHDEISQLRDADNKKFATEKEIMKRFSISRMTARQVLDNLVTDGLLYRERGKGVFINKRILQRSQYIHSFTELMHERGLTPSSKVLSFKKVVPPEIVRLTLGLPEETLCYEIERLRLANEQPFAVETIYTPVKLFPDLERYDFAKDSFYRILEQEYQQNFAYDKEVVSATKIEGSIAERLYRKKTGVALKVIDTLYNTDQKPLEYTESWYHAERYSYVSITQKR